MKTVHFSKPAIPSSDKEIVMMNQNNKTMALNNQKRISSLSCFILTAAVVVFSAALLLGSGLGLTPEAAAAAAVLTGDPIVVGTFGGYHGFDGRGDLRMVALLALNLSFNIQNAAGGTRGRPLQVMAIETNEDTSLIPGVVEYLVQNVSNLTVFANIIGEGPANVMYPKLVEHNMMSIQPNAGTRRWYNFDRHIMHILPSPDAEIFAQMSYIVKHLQVTRIGYMSDVAQDYGTELLPSVRAFAASIGASVVSHLKLNFTKSYDSADLGELAAMIAAKPHVIMNWGGLFPNNGIALTTLLLSLPDVHIICSIGQLPIVDAVLRLLPATTSLNNRILLTNVGPSYKDEKYALTKRLRASIAANPQPLLNLTHIDANPSLGMMAYLGFAVGELIGLVSSRIDHVNSTTFQNAVFKSTIVELDDLVMGPYSDVCVDTRIIYCSCNSGARQVDVVWMSTSLNLQTLPDASLVLPLSSCTAENLTLHSPLVASTIGPASSPSALVMTMDYMIGRNAAAVSGGDITVDGAVIDETYTGNSTAALQHLNTETLVTASAGSVLNTPIGDATGIGAVIDPMEVRPRLYGGFRRDVVYVSPTYEQELHALASLAVAQGKGITVLSALDDDGSAVGSTLTKSMNTLGNEGGGHRSSASIDSGLLATGDGGVTILHGIATSADIAAIATHLGQQTNAVVAIPMAHLLVWYRELVAAVTDESQRSRIVFATSLPNWAGPVSGETTGPALQTYFDRVPATNRTPGSLRGYMTHQLLTYVAGRIPNVKSPSVFLQTLYGASVIVMDSALVAGPYSDHTCVNVDDTTCEMNIGARLIRVRSLSASMTSTDGTASGQDASSITLDSGHISYKGLPTTDNTMRNIIIIVAVVGGLLVIGGVVALVLVCLCSGRSNWTAPKDESDAFTIIFTDIQSSTNLWAEAPEAMAPALDHHHALIRKLCIKHRGYEVKTIGDAFMVAFKDASDAVAMSSSLQFDFYNDKMWDKMLDHAYLEMDRLTTCDMNSSREEYSISLTPEDYEKVWNGLRVRIGIHTGFGEIKKDPVSHGYDYYGTVVNTAARTESIAHGGQVIMTDAALAASGISEDRVVPMGAVMLRGVPDPVHVYQLTTIENRVFPPLRECARLADSVIEDALSGGGGSESTELAQASLVPVKSTSWVAIQGQINAVLKTLISVHPVGPRGKFLMDTCRRWQLTVPNSEEDKTAFVTSPDALDKLSAKIAPIMARRKEFINNVELGYFAAAERDKSRSGGGGVSHNNFSFASSSNNQLKAVHSIPGFIGGGDASLSVDLPCISHQPVAPPPQPPIADGQQIVLHRGGGEEGGKGGVGHIDISDPQLVAVDAALPASQLPASQQLPIIVVDSSIVIVGTVTDLSEGGILFAEVEEAIPQSVVSMPDEIPT